MSDGYRRTALRIRALGERDQRWLLERLPAVEQEKVLAALQALDEDGAAASAHNGAAGEVHADDPVAVYVAQIGRATAAEIVPILAEAPDWLAACVLGYKRWSWTEGYWQALPAARRNAILQAMKHGQSSVKPKMKDTIVELLARAVARKRAVPANGYESFEKILKTLEQGPALPPKGRRFNWRFKWTR